MMLFRPSDHLTTKILSEAHVELLRGRRRPTPRKAPRGN
jgi:hypothetical protein